MKYLLNITSFLILLSGLAACSAPADKNILGYEQSLVRADSLAQSGMADSASAVRLLSDLRHEYTRVKELSEGKRIRLMPPDRTKHFLWGVFGTLMLGLNVWFSIRDIKFVNDRKHRRFLIDLSENEQRLRNNERERAELEECLDEMSLTDEEREEVQRSLTNLMAHGSRLCEENESLRLRLKEYEKRPLPREVERMKEQGERVRQLDEQVQALTCTLIDGDEVVDSLRRQPKFLSDAQWEYLELLADRVYSNFTHRLITRFPVLTPADRQLCLLMRMRFTNAQIATLTAVSPASVSQQKFRLKKRLQQTDGELFANGETLERAVCGC